MSLSMGDGHYSGLHFAGIFGSGMSAIAQYLKWSGLDISGSDRLLGSESTGATEQALRAMGCRIYPQDGSGISKDTEAVVVSTAIEEDNPDIRQARQLGIPVFHRSEVLAAVVASKRTIAVTGTSGKSTVAALIFHLLAECGRSPSLITGAGLHSLIRQGMIGNACRGDSDLLVIEADESDGSLVKYSPFISLFLNVSKDHKPVDEIIALFQELARRSRFSFAGDDGVLPRAVSATGTFGLDETAGLHPASVRLAPLHSESVIEGVTFRMPFPGMYMVVNLLAALLVCRFLECSPDDLARAVGSYEGISRRFDIMPSADGIAVIDDYAHNPDKITAALQAAQSLSPRVFALFQPHGFGPTRFMLDELAAAFGRTVRDQDRLYLLPIYYAGGTAQRDISSQDIADRIAGRDARILTPAHRDDAIRDICDHVRTGDAVISMGARDPSLADYAARIAAAIKDSMANRA